jgi:hypothetical protein
MVPAAGGGMVAMSARETTEIALADAIDRSEGPKRRTAGVDCS